MKRLRSKVKNARRRYKRKNKLPPLPPNFSGDAIEYYKSCYNLNLNLCYLQDHYWRESLALANIKHYNEIISHIDTIMKYPEERSVVDITPNHQDDKRTFIISQEDSALLASPDVFLHRIHGPFTPPPDRHINCRYSNDSAATITPADVNCASASQPSGYVTFTPESSRSPRTPLPERIDNNNFTHRSSSDDVNFFDV
ncbi:hypothetical protein RclHR1_00950001 [Rhizophagus clarus]|nr:hypothetical protein RclHR1_00950001 [Rhizophagus clarus]